MASEEASTADGGQSVSVYAGGVILVRIHGVVRQGADTNRVARYLMDAVQNSPVRANVFFDLKGFTQYDSDVRVRYTEAVRKPADKVARIWVFADSRIVRMGTAVAALALRQLSLVERQLFESELRNALEA